MLQLQESGNSESVELVSNAIEKMPNFSQEIQTNSVLTKRILALKVKDGIHIDMAEAEREMQSNMGKLKMNDQPVEQAPESEIQPEQTKPVGGQDLNLLDLDLGGAQQPANLVQEVANLSDLLGTSSSMPAQTKLKFQDAHPEDFSPQQTVSMPQDNSLATQGVANF